ncbi:Piso0_002823 [Millerozyma farinosa CBS 7064]|uniref:Piso0_002823 protein n=1 Tax=Pichia sorbitophila (strain ATCC MYA-4447 / BCRC 22081 / CBS 7064 / NBRC 10061 / NRRL Y-12695) TaxID=559304 RepID=G8YDL8_PICSO|nr:Piso0_002823 [Millerozyma farinosa CBS 7064]
MTAKVISIAEAPGVYPNLYLEDQTIRKPKNLLDGCLLTKELIFKEKLGAGSFGLIYLVENLHTGRLYAAKILLMNPPTSSAGSRDVREYKKYIQAKIFDYFSVHSETRIKSLDEEYIAALAQTNDVFKEIHLHLKVHEHPNVITIHDILEVDDFAVVTLMDYYEQGDLYHSIVDQNIFLNIPERQEREKLMKNAILQIIEAVTYCHSKGLFHCDLKPENILVKYSHQRAKAKDSPTVDLSQIHLVLIDFGLAMEDSKIRSNVCRGSSFYMPPERLSNFDDPTIISMLNSSYSSNDTVSATESFTGSSSADYNQNVKCAKDYKFSPTAGGDVWSIGVLCLNIACARNPWPIARFNEKKNDVYSTFMLHNSNVLALILPISSSFNSVLKKVFTLDPDRRISITKLRVAIRNCMALTISH